jgi:hypothetical protein
VQTVHAFGLEPLNPFGDGLRRRMELASGRALGQPEIHHRANHHLSTFGRKRRILMGVHSALRESLAFADFSVHRPNRMDNLLKSHI